MKTANQFQFSLPFAALAGLALTAGFARAAVEVTPDHIVTGSATGTLVAIDPPKKSGDDGNVAGVGFSGTLGGDDGGSTRGAWEPDGTVAASQWHIGWVNNGVVTYTFDLPDGVIIHSVYHKWNGQSNQSSNVVYRYDEGTPTTTARDHDVASTGNLVLKWTDSLAVAHNTNFERLFSGPITVAGGNGFIVTVDSRVTDGVDTSKVMSLDAVVLDVTISGTGNAFSDWISTPAFGLDPGDQGFAADPDGDNLGNGVEAFFGTNPGSGNAGLSHVSKSGAVFTFQHPEANPPLSDVTGSYEWSLDLANWHPSGTVGDTTVTITPSKDDPVAGTTTVTTDTTGSVTLPSKLFVRAVAAQN